MKRMIILAPVIILLIWFAISHLNVINPLFLPAPEIVFIKLGELLVTGQIIPDVTMTLLRMFAGFALAMLIGIPIGLLMGYYRRVYDSLQFIVDFFRSLPATALFPLFLLFFGIGDAAKIAVVTFACSLIIIVNTMYGVRNATKLRIIAAKTMKANKIDLFKKVIIPEALPAIFTGLRIAISLALILVIVTEMFIGTMVGLGHIIIDSQLIYNIPEMYSAIILTGMLGYLINMGVIRIENKFVHWSGK